MSLIVEAKTTLKSEPTEEGFHHTLRYTRLILLTSISPTDFLEQYKKDGTIDYWNTYRLIIPGRYAKEAKEDTILRYGHTGPNNKGAIEFKFSTPQEMIFDSDKKEVHTVMGPYASLIDNAFKETSSVLRVVVDFAKRTSIKLPPYIKRFIDTYVAFGAHRTSEFSDYYNYKNQLDRIDWKKVMSWYQIRYKSKLPIPHYVYRGINLSAVSKKQVEEITSFLATMGLTREDLKSGVTAKYKHPFNFPISTSTSRSVARRFASSPIIPQELEALGVILRFKVDPKDVVFDCRPFMTEHNAQSEINLRPDKVYDVELMDVKHYVKGTSQATTIAITNRPITKESAQLVMDCLKYVYSWGDFRDAAIYDLEQAASKWNISKVDKHLILKLPYDRIVYRWIDYRWDKMHKFLNTLHHDKCYDRGRQMYSFTMYKNVRQAEQYLVRDKGYGALLQYDLADMSGYAVPIVSVMRYLMNADRMYELVLYLIKHQMSEAVDFLYNLGALSDVRFTRDPEVRGIEFERKKYMIEPREVKKIMSHYLFQKEILVFSKETSTICPGNLVRVYEE